MRTTRKFLVLIGALLLGGGIAIAAGSADSRLPRVRSDKDADRVKPNYQRNMAGETFGSLSQAEVDADAPDLILAHGRNGAKGIDGYVRSKDLILPMPKSPEEAVAQNTTKIRSIPLYAVDGKTVVGEYRHGGAGAVARPAPGQ